MMHSTQAVAGSPGRTWSRGVDGGAWGPQPRSPIPGDRPQPIVVVRVDDNTACSTNDPRLALTLVVVGCDYVVVADACAGCPVEAVPQSPPQTRGQADGAEAARCVGWPSCLPACLRWCRPVSVLTVAGSPCADTSPCLLSACLPAPSGRLRARTEEVFKRLTASLPKLEHLSPPPDLKPYPPAFDVGTLRRQVHMLQVPPPPPR